MRWFYDFLGNISSAWVQFCVNLAVLSMTHLQALSEAVSPDS